MFNFNITSFDFFIFWIINGLKIISIYLVCISTIITDEVAQNVLRDKEVKMKFLFMPR